jgi:hypothetical protein
MLLEHSMNQKYMYLGTKEIFSIRAERYTQDAALGELQRTQHVQKSSPVDFAGSSVANLHHLQLAMEPNGGLWNP